MFLKTIVYLLLVELPIAAQSPLSLADATARTLAQNRDVLAASMAVQGKENEALAARSRRWPTLSTSAQIGPLLNRPELTFTKGILGNNIPATNETIGIPRQISGYGLSQASLPLTQQWRLGLAVKQANEETAASREEASQARLAAETRVRTFYFQIVALNASVRVAEAQLAAAEEVLRLAQEGVEKGTALQADEARAGARAAQAKADVANIAADLEDGFEQLNLLMGEPLTARFALTTTRSEDVTFTQQEARAQALASRPELREARIRLEQANLSVRNKRLEQIPDVSLVVSDIYLLNTSNYLPNQLASAGLSLSWEPWDWGRKQHEAAALRAKEEQQRLALKQLEEQISFETDRAWRDYDRAQRNFHAAQLATESAQEQLRIVKERFTKQAALLRDLLEIEADWQNAGQTEARAQAAVGVAWANLQSAMGNK